MKTLQELSTRLDDLIQFNVEAEAGSWLAKARLMRGANITTPPGGLEGLVQKSRRLGAIRRANTKFQQVGWKPGTGY